MFIVSRKKMSLLLLCICLLLCTFLTKINSNNGSIETVALPVTNKIIILDAGHGYPDKGATSNSRITEASINLKIALKVQNLLEQNGARVILTRSDENGIYDADKNTIRERKISDMKNRAKIGNESGANIFVSIHLNKIPQQQYWGWQTFFKENNDQSKKLATCLQEGLNNSIQKENKREPLKIDNIYLIKNVEIPISIVECGFLSNPEEEQKMQKDEYQNQLAWGIYTGIMSYFLETP